MLGNGKPLAKDSQVQRSVCLANNCEDGSRCPDSSRTVRESASSCILSQHLVTDDRPYREGSSDEERKMRHRSSWALIRYSLTLVEDNKDRLLRQHAGFRVGDGSCLIGADRTYTLPRGTEIMRSKQTLSLGDR
jgi:hypothetical protein